MRKKQFSIALLAVLCSFVEIDGANIPPRLVVNIIVEGLRSDYLQYFSPYYGEQGFKKLLSQGRVYQNAEFTFAPVDCVSATASLMTGTSPYFNSITASQWLDRSTLKTIASVDDESCSGINCEMGSSAQFIATSTIADELKIMTKGKAKVFGIARKRDVAVLSAGHCSDGAFWINEESRIWASSTYYFKSLPKWADAYNRLHNPLPKGANDCITDMAIQCVSSCAVGTDNVTDMLCIGYDATENAPLYGENVSVKDIYGQLDRNIATLISWIESRIGRSNVLFTITSCSAKEKEEKDYQKYNVPTGTFYINRTANLLNMYLGAIYGQDKYVEACFLNQIYLNNRLIDQKRLNMSEILNRSQIFLLQNAGVKNAYTSEWLLKASTKKAEKLREGFNLFHSGDLMVETAPGWQLLNEENGQRQQYASNFVPYPIMFYGWDIKAKTSDELVTMDRIAPTISKSIQIRAPNACTVTPLF